MRTQIIRGRYESELHLEPETEQDQRLLESLVADYKLMGYGRHSGDNRLLHVRIKLTESEKGN